jgi:hypothetical protein
MLAPLVVDGFHFFAMVGVATILLIERQVRATCGRLETIGDFNRATARTVASNQGLAKRST